jgi:alpha-ketoglutarate-dependent taurine dioxygenase
MSEPPADEGCVVGPRLSPAGGVAILGIDLSRPLLPASRQRIFDAFLATHVVVFAGQTLSREAQFAFTANFGEVEGPEACRAHGKRQQIAHVISNLDGAGNPVDRSSSAVSNYRWHTDKSYYRTPPSMTTLYGVELPSHGGDTEFANTALAYAALPAATKRRIAPLRVVFRWGAVLGQPPEPDPARPPPVDHPLVRIHPETGVRALYLGNHASHILGLPAAEGASLLDALLAHTTRPEFVYTHRWRKGDLVMWDNRCLLHRAVANYAVGSERRILHRTVVRGTVPFGAPEAGPVPAIDRHQWAVVNSSAISKE